MERKVFVTDYIGLCNRLEALTLSFAFQEYFGHEVCVNWPELDALRIIGARKRSLTVFDRIGAIKLRDCNEAEFAAAGKFRNVIQRTPGGMGDILDRLFLETAARLRLHPAFIDVIRKTFLAKGTRPIVGVHIRRGDFTLVDENAYDSTATRHPAVPTWWYEHVMGRIVQRHPDTLFFLSCTGNPADYAALKKHFDIFELPTESPYGYKGPGHASERHPVADLFALACCRLIIASPMSSFSHYAANALGLPSTTIIPPVRMAKAKPMFGTVYLHGQRLPLWNRAAREEYAFTLVETPTGIPEPQQAALAWL